MLIKCCNPECEAPFDYRAGQLIRVSEAHSSGKLNQLLIRHFWLCGSCAEHYVLEQKSGIAVVVRPREKEVARQPAFSTASAA